MAFAFNYEICRSRLEAIGQDHVLKFYHELPEKQKFDLLAQVSVLDLPSVPRLVTQYVINKPRFELPPNLKPAPYFPASGKRGVGGGGWDPAAARAIGEQLLRDGKVAAFTVAGGQGSRLGYEGPKGCYPAGAVSKKPLFEMFADALWKTGQKYGKPVPWYIMTSPLNHAATRDFFSEHAYFGLNRKDIMFFQQGVMPSFDIHTGKILMASKAAIATNPDGHGGALRALWAGGIDVGPIADMKRRGVQHISYFQVDNPIVKVADPVFLGLHAGPKSSGEMSSKMIPKAYPEEKLGLFCRVDNRIDIIEYSDLPKELAAERLPDGSLRFLSGSIAVHILSVNFVERLNTDAAFELPYHRAEKKVPCIDIETGQPLDPKANNAVKLERFVFDAIPLCRSIASEPGSIVYETDRIEEFAPIKNATGVDSVESCREIQTERAARWLESVDVKVARKADRKPDCVLEINGRTAIEPTDLKAATLPQSITPGETRIL
jgi:UDP-N-acetylglucosamine/UDP-N-acetylgalactosamine diphosphorylase